MYKNLMSCMKDKHITQVMLCELLGISSKTATNKIYGRTDWTLPEALKIKKFLFPEYDLSYLFEFDETAA